jgi:hypothetical protein
VVIPGGITSQLQVLGAQVNIVNKPFRNSLKNTLRVIIEQSMEYVANLYLLFVDFENAFDSLGRNKMWDIMRKYDVPGHIINIVKQTYEGYMCQIVHGGKLTDPIPVLLGANQGRILSATIFLMLMDEVMRKAIRGKRRGITWGITEQLEDLDFADDIFLLSHTFYKMETKLKDLENEGKTVGLKINCGKKSLSINTRIDKNLSWINVKLKK